MSDQQKKQWINRRGAQPVADLVSKLLNPVFERRAGMTMDLIASWEEIAGEQHAAKSRPEKLVWPRQASDNDPFEPATLVVACDSGHAVFLQHDSSTVINRVNGYFGFAAVARLKLLQKPVGSIHPDKKLKQEPLPADKSVQLDELLTGIDDPELKQALKKMGRGVFSKGSSPGS